MPGYISVGVALSQSVCSAPREKLFLLCSVTPTHAVGVIPCNPRCRSTRESFDFPATDRPRSRVSVPCKTRSHAP
jgi:hypothetical protein